MNNVTELPKTEAQKAIAAAREELAAEQLKKGVKLFKAKLLEEAEAVTVLANIRRELEDLEGQIEQGNI